MNKKKILVFHNVEELAENLAGLLKKTMDETPDGKFTTIALSGGSTPKHIFDYVSSNHSEKIHWNKALFFWVDERCVSPEDESSNYLMTRLHLFDKLNVPDKQIFRIFGEADPLGEAKRYGRIITKKLPVKDGFPRFDLVLLGIGEDGHTASIFPGNIMLFKSERICEIVVHPQSQQKRITLTGSVINNARNIVFLVTGAEKAEIVAQILQKGENSDLPASFVKPVNGKLFWMLDEAASKLLTKIP